MAGYHNYSMSNNAIAARNSGRLPASDAAKVWGFKSVKALREHINTNEYHHTSKKYNITYFYDVESKYEDFDLIQFNEIYKVLTKRGKEIANEYVKDLIKRNLDDIPNITNLQWKSGYFHAIYPRPKSYDEAKAMGGNKRRNFQN